MFLVHRELKLHPRSDADLRPCIRSPLLAKNLSVHETTFKKKSRRVLARMNLENEHIETASCEALEEVMKLLAAVFFGLLVLMQSASAGSVQLGKPDSLYSVQNGRTYYGPGSGATGEICNLGDYNCYARQTSRANRGGGHGVHGHHGGAVRGGVIVRTPVVGVVGYAPRINCAPPRVRTINPNTGRPSCFVPD